MTDSLIRASAGELAEMIGTGRVSAVEVFDAHVRRIEAVNPAVNAIVQLAAEHGREAAQRADQAVARGEPLGPLHGVPITIKDCFATADLITTSGTAGRAGFVPERDATLVARLREAGAIVLGKTNMSELGLGHETDNLVYGRTNNPYDLDRTPGGSSGGAAAAVACGMSPLDVGSDGGGSVRVPAHYCGVAALKPTHGRVPTTGYFPSGAWVDPLFGSIGPIARRVADLHRCLAIIAGPDGLDPDAVPAVLVDPASARVPDLRVAYYPSDELFPAADDIARVVRDSARALDGLGCDVTEASLDVFEPAVDSWMNILLADAAGLEALIESVGGEARVHPWTRVMLEHYREHSPQLELGDLTECLATRHELRAAMTAAMTERDVLLCPCAGFPAPLHGAGLDADNALGYSYSIMWNAIGWPAGVVRCGTSATGLPIGVQIVAPPWHEHVILAIAGALEQCMGGWQPPDESHFGQSPGRKLPCSD